MSSEKHKKKIPSQITSPQRGIPFLQCLSAEGKGLLQCLPRGGEELINLWPPADTRQGLGGSARLNPRGCSALCWWLFMELPSSAFVLKLDSYARGDNEDAGCAPETLFVPVLPVKS